MLDNIFIRFGTKLYRQVVDFPMGTNCDPLVADLFLFCYERDFMMSLYDDIQTNIIDTFNTTTRYFDDILNINNIYFDNIVSQIYPVELQLNKAKPLILKPRLWTCICLFLMILFLSKFMIRRDDIEFEIVNFPFLDGEVSRSKSYGVYFSQLI